jgi:hypothetical protein
MKTPHLGLLRMYGNSEVFFKTASLEPRLSDQIGQLVAGSLLEKIARLPAVPGHAPIGLSAPPMRRLMGAAGGAAPKTPISDGLAQATKPAPMPKSTAGGHLPRPNVNDFTVNQGTMSSAPAAPAGGQMKSPLANPRVGGIATGGHAPNVNDFTKQPQQPGVLQRTMGRLTGQQSGAPTINPLEAPKGGTPQAADKPITQPASGKPAEPAASKGSGGLPWNRMLLTGGLLGAGALGLGAMKAGLNFLGGGHGGPANYGAAPGGYMPPMGVNQYGYPQMGTPIM